jgi:hypothetical protein
MFQCVCCQWQSMIDRTEGTVESTNPIDNLAPTIKLNFLPRLIATVVFDIFAGPSDTIITKNGRSILNRELVITTPIFMSLLCVCNSPRLFSLP